MTEIFLICALSLSVLSVPADNPPQIHSRPVRSSQHTFYRLLKNQGHMLVVGGNPILVWQMRQQRNKAFGVLTDMQFNPTKWHAIARPEKLPFRYGFFDSVWFRMRNHNEENWFWLVESLRMVRPGRYFLFDDFEFPGWPPLLHYYGWTRLPFRFKEMGVWQKPFYWQYLKQQKLMGVTTHGKHVLGTAA